MDAYPSVCHEDSSPSTRRIFSADVSLNLYVRGQRIELGQLGPGFAIFRDFQRIDECEAEIETNIDGKINRWPVRIIGEITGESKRFTFEPRK